MRHPSALGYGRHLGGCWPTLSGGFARSSSVAGGWSVLSIVFEFLGHNSSMVMHAGVCYGCRSVWIGMALRCEFPATKATMRGLVMRVILNPGNGDYSENLDWIMKMEVVFSFLFFFLLVVG